MLRNAQQKDNGVRPEHVTRAALFGREDRDRRCGSCEYGGHWSQADLSSSFPSPETYKPCGLPEPASSFVNRQ